MERTKFPMHVVHVLRGGKDGLFGVIEDGKEVVPFSHKEAYDAVMEWDYFERANIGKRFLGYVLKGHDIGFISDKLLSTGDAMFRIDAHGNIEHRY